MGGGSVKNQHCCGCLWCRRTFVALRSGPGHEAEAEGSKGHQMRVLMPDVRVARLCVVSETWPLLGLFLSWFLFLFFIGSEGSKIRNLNQKRKKKKKSSKPLPSVNLFMCFFLTFISIVLLKQLCSCLFAWGEKTDCHCSARFEFWAGCDITILGVCGLQYRSGSHNTKRRREG